MTAGGENKIFWRNRLEGKIRLKCFSVNECEIYILNWKMIFDREVSSPVLKVTLSFLDFSFILGTFLFFLDFSLFLRLFPYIWTFLTKGPLDFSLVSQIFREFTRIRTLVCFCFVWTFVGKNLAVVHWKAFSVLFSLYCIWTVLWSAYLQKWQFFLQQI